jgi:hypothetical protein
MHRARRYVEASPEEEDAGKKRHDDPSAHRARETVDVVSADSLGGDDRGSAQHAQNRKR